MKKLILAALAAAFLAAGCATADSASGPPSVRSAKEDSVTGSRLPRSDANENYQGAKSMTRKDYEDYKASTGLKGGS